MQFGLDSHSACEIGSHGHEHEPVPTIDRSAPMLHRLAINHHAANFLNIDFIEESINPVNMQLPVDASAQCECGRLARSC